MSMNTQRNNYIAEDFVDGKSIEDLAASYGLGKRMIHRILRDKGLRTEDRKVTLSVRDRQKMKSQLHKSIGQRLHDHYFITKGMTRAMAAEELGISAKALKGIEVGSNPLPLTELQNIASFMGTTIKEIIDGD